MLALILWRVLAYGPFHRAADSQSRLLPNKSRTKPSWHIHCDLHPSSVNKSARFQWIQRQRPCFKKFMRWLHTLPESYTWRSKDKAVMFVECVPWLTARYQEPSSPFVIVPCNQVLTMYLCSADAVIGCNAATKTLLFCTFSRLLSSPRSPLCSHLYLFICCDFLISEMHCSAGIKK